MNKKILSYSIFTSLTVIASQSAMARLDNPYAFPNDVPDIPFVGEGIKKSPDYSLVQVHLGGDIGAYYNDNIFRSPNDKEGDFITVINPGIALETNFEDHDFNAYAQFESNIYASNSESNYTDIEFGMDGDYALSDTHQIFGELSLGQYHSPIGALIDDPNDQLAEPVSYFASKSEIGIAATFEKWIYSVSGLWNTYDYDDTKRRNGTVSIQDDRDRDDLALKLKTGYRVSPQTIAYVQGGLNQRSYDERIDSSAAFTRDSDGYEILTGLHFDNDKNLDTDIAVGFARQDYDAAQLPSVSIPAFLIGTTWDMDAKNQFRFQADSSIKDTTTTGVSAYVQNRFRVNYTHDLNDIFEIGLEGQYLNNNFETNSSLNPIDREDDIYQAEIYGEYEIYDDIDLNISYEYRDRQSNVATAEYDSHIIGARLMFDY